jgi:acyl-CoA thioesterase-2
VLGLTDSPLLVAPGADGTPSSGWCHAGAPGRAFGGQVAAQALLAGSRTVPADREVVSLHAHYVGPGDIERPVDYLVDVLHDGRSFASRTVRAVQGPTTLALVTLTFALPGPHGPELARMAPPVAPAALTPPTPFTDTPSGRAFTRYLEQRVVTWASDVRPEQEPGSMPVERRWMRMTVPLEDAPPAHRAGLAYLSDIRLASTPAAHVREQGRTLAVTTLDHAVWWHRPARVDEWLLFDQSAVSWAAGLALSQADVFAADGRLVASTAQHALIRVLDQR